MNGNCRSRVIAWGGGALAASLLALGCSVPGTSPPPPSEPPPVPPATPTDQTSSDPSASPSSTPDPSDTASPSGAPSGSTGPAEPPAGTRTATINGERLTLTVFPIRRTGTLSVLDFTVSRPAGEPGEQATSFLLTTTFSDQNSAAGDRSPWTVDGVRLVDGTNRKAYLVASETGGRCLCSTEINTIDIQPGETYDFYATFAAPPPDVTELEVNAPRFGAIPRVPVR